ncbi:MAG: hypothetical protein PUF76_10595, partial [bacterium]|nr:hypothetical protein [bacterium]
MAAFVKNRAETLPFAAGTQFRGLKGKNAEGQIRSWRNAPRMREPGLKEAEKYENARQRKKRWYQVVTCLAAVVVFCTTYALILPAITLSRDNPKLGADHLTAPCGESLTLDVTAKPEDEAG